MAADRQYFKRVCHERAELRTLRWRDAAEESRWRELRQKMARY